MNLFIKKAINNMELTFAITCGVFMLFGFLFRYYQVISIIFYVLAYIIGGYVKAKEGIIESIQEKDLNVDLLMMIAALGAAAIGYWEDGAMLIFIFAMSGSLETYTFNKSHKEISALIKLQPETATKIINGQENMVSVKDLQIGDIILIKPGELIPADGTISQGQTNVDESSITGESIPSEKNVGDDVFASTINLRGSVQVTITKPTDQTLFQRIIYLVQNAQNEKSPSQLFIEKYEGTYVKSVLVIVIASILLSYYVFGLNLYASVYRGMILLVVASPCALVASITPATLSAISNGAKNGILFKGGIQLEILSQLKAVAFDKTGTLTKGKPSVTDIIVRDNISIEDMLTITASIESHSTHPLADAIIKHAQSEYNISITDPQAIENVPGLGIIGTFNNIIYKIGKADFIGETTNHFNFETVQKLQQEGKTLVYTSDDQGVVGLIALKDTIREETVEAISQLKNLSIQSIMITGDNPFTAQVMAHESGITEYYASCLPEEKVNKIKELKEKYKVVSMVGDGINDAPALAMSNVGIAMGGGTDVALETADIVLMKNDLNSLAKAVNLSKKLKKITKQNIAFALIIIVSFIVASFVTVVPIPLAVIAHEGSTILVILNGLRLLRN